MQIETFNTTCFTATATEKCETEVVRTTMSDDVASGQVFKVESVERIDGFRISPVG